ncbi:hypothetical protein BU16DRAFT_578916 [Lophium mytilinum]|uniref:Uncharacterized protein n=1 Tax=Lophium mytilinum TaxID=390894 RepID=A0A6A6R4N0_9PEZI|nr:hypothetical protein BU16DRAFT_578916 [Lophium mytilinum]
MADDNSTTPRTGSMRDDTPELLRGDISRVHQGIHPETSGSQVLKILVKRGLSRGNILWVLHLYLLLPKKKAAADAISTINGLLEIPRDLTFRQDDFWIHTDKDTNMIPFSFIGFAYAQNHEYYIRSSEATHQNPLNSIAIKLVHLGDSDIEFEHCLNMHLKGLVTNIPALTEIQLIAPECYSQAESTTGMSSTCPGCRQQYDTLEQRTRAFKQKHGNMVTIEEANGVLRCVWTCRVAGDQGEERKVTLRFGYHGEVPCRAWMHYFRECT